MRPGQTESSERQAGIAFSSPVWLPRFQKPSDSSSASFPAASNPVGTAVLPASIHLKMPGSSRYCTEKTGLRFLPPDFQSQSKEPDTLSYIPPVPAHRSGENSPHQIQKMAPRRIFRNRFVPAAKRNSALSTPALLSAFSPLPPDNWQTAE